MTNIYKLFSKKETSYPNKLTIKINSKQMYDMLKLISRNANIGHSFDIVVDPDMKGSSDEQELYGKFFIDGDGPDRFLIEKEEHV